MIASPSFDRTDRRQRASCRRRGDICFGPDSSPPVFSIAGQDRLDEPAPALAAARGFSEGNGYLTGQVIDRRA